MASASTVIIGCGIIGCATAYYLSLNDEHRTIHIVDSSPVLFENVASGKAAGFLAKDWFSAPVSELGGLSFDLHKKLAEEFGGRDGWGWSQSLSFGLNTSENTAGLGDEWDWLTTNRSRAQVSRHSTTADETRQDEDPSWLKSWSNLDPLSEPGTTAQVDPLRLCRFLLQQCTSRSNVHLHSPATVTEIMKSEEQAITRVRVLYQQFGKTLDIACNDLIVTSGPWTTSVLSTLFPHKPPSSLPQVMSLSGHSVILRSKHWPQPGLDSYCCHALFITDPSSGFSPEIFSRVGGEIYVAGVNDSESPLPPSSASVITPDPNDITRLINLARKLFKGGDDVEIIGEGLCFRPITNNGNPIIGKLGSVSEEGFNVWVASGHGPWGISLSLGTGLILSQLVMGLPTSANVRKLAPKYR